MYQSRMKKNKQYVEVGTRLRGLLAYLQQSRKPDKFNQTIWGAELHVSQSRMSNWLSGTRRPSTDEALKMCELYGVSLDFIYRGKSDILPHNMATFLSEYSLDTNSQKSTDKPVE